MNFVLGKYLLPTLCKFNIWMLVFYNNSFICYLNWPGSDDFVFIALGEGGDGG